MTFQPSPQQSAIFDEISRGTSNIIVDAKAGSGKTTTILEGMKYIPRGDSLLPPAITFLAFNKNIADTLKARVPSGVSCSTFHSLGLRALKASGHVDPVVARSKDFVDGRKVPRLVWNAMDRDAPDVQNVIRLVGLAKSQWPTAVEESDWRVLITHHDLQFEDERFAISVAVEVLRASDKDLKKIDFDDMLRLPVLLDAPFDLQDWIFVDEAQDLNSVQQEIVGRLRKIVNCHDDYEKPYSPTRLIAVGDPHQAIYAFRGASHDSMDLLAARFGCKTFPLSVSYRCPRLVVAEAQKYLTQTT